VLLERVGIRGTALLAAGAAVLFAFLSRLVAPAVRTDSRGPPADRRQARTPLIVAYGLSGFAALGYEVVWARALTTILGQPVYGFTIVTATFLAGLAIGSYVGGRLADRWRDPQLGFATIELLLSLAAFLPTALLALATRTLVGNLVAAAHGVWFLRTALLAGFCFMLMLIPAVLAGATFPVACRVLLPRRGAVGPGVGRLCAANSFGALAGSLVSGLVLIPWLGTIGTNIALAVVSFAAAVVVVAGARHRSLPRLGMAAAFGVVFVLVAAFVAPRRLRILPPDVASAPGAWRVLHYDETGEGVVTTAEGRSGDRQTWVNSSVVCGTALPALKPVRVMGLLPFALLDCPADILVIGYGLGVTASLLTALSPRSVDCVEICPGVVAASQAFADWNNRVYASPNLRLMAGDGRNYLLCTNRTYDVISCDPTHPALGSGALYTADFYRLCRRRLKPGGILTLYLPLHKLTGRDFRGLLATFRQAFPDCALWFGIAHGVLVGRRDAPLRLDYRRLAGLFARMPQTVRDALADVFIDTPAQFCGLCLLGPAGMARASVGGGLVTDDRPAVEFAGSRTSDTRTWSANAQAVTSAWTGPADVVVNAGADSLPVMSASLAAAERFRATTAAARGDRPSQAAAFAQALMYDPADREAALFLQMSAPRQ
jgi:spermidine synthase